MFNHFIKRDQKFLFPPCHRGIYFRKKRSVPRHKKCYLFRWFAGTPRLARPPRPGPCLDFGFQYAFIRNNRSKNFLGRLLGLAWLKFAVASLVRQTFCHAPQSLHLPIREKKMCSSPLAIVIFEQVARWGQIPKTHFYYSTSTNLIRTAGYCGKVLKAFCCYNFPKLKEKNLLKTGSDKIIV